MTDLELMVAGSKQTTYLEKPAWLVPNGRCTTDFKFACRCWKHFLNGNTSGWLPEAVTLKPDSMGVI